MFFCSNTRGNVLLPARRSRSYPVPCPSLDFTCPRQFTGCIELRGLQTCVWCSKTPGAPCILNTHQSQPVAPPTPRPTFVETPSPTREPTTPTEYVLDVNFRSTVPSWMRTVANNAVNKWKEIITSDYQHTFTVPNNNCPGVTAGTQVDDSLVSIGYEYIDGSSGSNTLAYAGTCFYSLGKSRVCAIVMDSSNFASSGSSVLAYNVIIHEIGHCLGIQSTAWRNNNLADNNYKYTGVHANAQLAGLGANHNQALIEDLYGDGSRGSHWRESVYDSEVMTSIAEYNEMQLSRLTIGALEDLGYSVDYSKADAYTVPSPNGRRLRKKKGVPFHSSVMKLPFGSEDSGFENLKEKERGGRGKGIGKGKGKGKGVGKNKHKNKKP